MLPERRRIAELALRADMVCWHAPGFDRLKAPGGWPASSQDLTPEHWRWYHVLRWRVMRYRNRMSATGPIGRATAETLATLELAALETRNQLVALNVPLAHYWIGRIAENRKKRGLPPVDDLDGISYEKLVAAACEFNWSGGIRFATLFCRCVLNAVMDSDDRRKYRETVALASAEHVLGPPGPEFTRTDRDAAVAAIETLDPIERTVIRARHGLTRLAGGGSSFDDIGRAIGYTRSATARIAERAMRKLRETLGVTTGQ